MNLHSLAKIKYPRNTMLVGLDWSPAVVIIVDDNWEQNCMEKDVWTGNRRTCFPYANEPTAPRNTHSTRCINEFPPIKNWNRENLPALMNDPEYDTEHSLISYCECDCHAKDEVRVFGTYIDINGQNPFYNDTYICTPCANGQHNWTE